MKKLFLFLIILAILLANTATIYALEYKPITNIPYLTDERGLGAIDSGGVAGFINSIITLTFSLAGIAAVLAIVSMGFMYIFGEQSAQMRKKLREKGLSITAGLGLVFGIFIYLNIINPELLNLDILGGMGRIEFEKKPEGGPKYTSFASGDKTERIVFTNDESVANSTMNNKNVIKRCNDRGGHLKKIAWETSFEVICDTSATPNGNAQATSSQGKVAVQATKPASTAPVTSSAGTGGTTAKVGGQVLSKTSPLDSATADEMLKQRTNISACERKGGQLRKTPSGGKFIIECVTAN